MIEPRLWLRDAQNIPVGSDDKIIHKGCGQRPSLWVFNAADKWGCYCHRCRQTGSVVKEHQRIKVKVPPKTGHIPTDLAPVINALADDPASFAYAVERYDLGKHLSRLTYSADTGRVYFPDASKSYLGMDVTGKAYARFYSPYKRNLCTSVGGSGSLKITGSLTEYLTCVQEESDAILVMNRAAEEYTTAYVSVHYDKYDCIYVDAKLNRRFQNNVRVFT